MIPSDRQPDTLSDVLPEALREALFLASPLAVAYSGGLDSRFLAHAAANLERVDFVLFHATGPHLSPRESAAASAWAGERGFALGLAPVDPLVVPEVRANGRERCYFCKRALFTALAGAAAGHPLLAGRRFTLCDGSNASDKDGYRPGLRALGELGVFSPLAEAGLRKDDIRLLAARSGMDRPEQKARPCLLTRFAYDMAPDQTILAALARAEDAVEDIMAGGFGPHVPDFRLRLTSLRPLPARSGPARYVCELHLERPVPAAMEAALAEAVAAAGFARPKLVSAGVISGYYDNSR
ncbi:MAG: hypothetical protein LBH65_03875 [Desulfovibrio sp.]|jgi:uncharacterized protein|nr:hypothetical protein [Desulfovibrio sp.]